MTLATAISVFGLALLVDILVQHRSLARGIRLQRRNGERPAHHPSVTVIRPVRGCDVGAAENFRAALDTGYPGEVETLFVFDDEADPGLPLARALVQEHRASGRAGRAQVLVVGPPPRGRTGKLNAMIHGVAHARGELIAFGDSDTRPDDQVLEATVDMLLTRPGAGCAFAPVLVPGPAKTAGDLGYAMLLNAWYGPSVAQQAARSGDVPFIMGQLMVLTREALQAIGGVECAQGQLTDDMYIGLCIARAGLRNVMSAHPLTVVTGGMSLADFARLFRRWLLFSRNGLPAAFTWPMWQRGLEFWLGVVAVGIGIGSGHLAAALWPLAGLVAYSASMALLQQDFGGERVQWRHAWVPLLIPVLAPAMFFAGLARRQVSWRGRSYALGAQARLA